MPCQLRADCISFAGVSLLECPPKQGREPSAAPSVVRETRKRLTFSQTVYSPSLSSRISFCLSCFRSRVKRFYSVTLTVPPRIAPFEMADRAVNWGDSVSAVCTIVNGDSPLEITWALNGMPVEENHRISVTTTKRNSLLSIDSASPSHAGTYTCVASNAAGATTYSAELTVNGTYSDH